MAACSRDYDVDLPAHQSELVVECYLEDGQPLRAIVTESTALLDTSLVPPVVLPELGETEFTVGAGGAEPLVDFGKIVPSLRRDPGAAFK